MQRWPGGDGKWLPRVGSLPALRGASPPSGRLGAKVFQRLASGVGRGCFSTATHGPQFGRDGGHLIDVASQPHAAAKQRYEQQPGAKTGSVQLFCPFACQPACATRHAAVWGAASGGIERACRSGLNVRAVRRGRAARWAAGRACPFAVATAAPWPTGGPELRLQSRMTERFFARHAVAGAGRSVMPFRHEQRGWLLHFGNAVRSCGVAWPPG